MVYFVFFLFLMAFNSVTEFMLFLIGYKEKQDFPSYYKSGLGYVNVYFPCK